MLLTFSRYIAKEDDRNEAKLLLAQSLCSSYSSSHKTHRQPNTFSLEPPAQATKDDVLVNQVTALLKLKKIDEACRVSKTALEKESKQERTIHDIDNLRSTIASFEKVKQLINNEFQWFGVPLFGHSPLPSGFSDTLVKLNDTLKMLTNEVGTATVPKYFQERG